MGFPVILPVGWHDDRLKTPGCSGFAVFNDVASFSTTDVGLMLIYHGWQVAQYRYFSLVHDGDAPQNQPANGDIYNTLWVLGGINGSNLTDGGLPVSPLAEDPSGQAYCIVDSEDDTQVVAGLMLNIPMTYCESNKNTVSGYCYIPLDFVWIPTGGAFNLYSNAFDASGYAAQSRPPVGGMIDSPEFAFPIPWHNIFPPPNYVELFGNNVGPDPVWPLCIEFHSNSDANGNGFSMRLRLPQTPMQMIENPSPYSCSDTDLLASNYLGGGLPYAPPPPPGECPSGGDAGAGKTPVWDGFVNVNEGYDDGVAVFNFLCNIGCITSPDWIGWMIGVQVSNIEEVYIPPAFTTKDLPFVDNLPNAVPGEPVSPDTSNATPGATPDKQNLSNP